MSEPIPESIPTSQDPRSKRPLKRLALSPTGQQAHQLNVLFANPDREVAIPDAVSSSAAAKARGGLAPPPEIVANVQGSSAGAGSGEFHVYKASRRREYERLRLMDDEVKREREDEDFDRQKAAKGAKDAAKTSKNKAKREKVKERKAKGKDASGSENGHNRTGTDQAGAAKPRIKSSLRVVQLARDGGVQAENGNDDVEGERVSGNQVSTIPDEIGVVILEDE